MLELPSCVIATPPPCDTCGEKSCGRAGEKYFCRTHGKGAIKQFVANNLESSIVIDVFSNDGERAFYDAFPPFCNIVGYQLPEQSNVL